VGGRRLRTVDMTGLATDGPALGPACNGCPERHGPDYRDLLRLPLSGPDGEVVVPDPRGSDSTSTWPPLKHTKRARPRPRQRGGTYQHRCISSGGGRRYDTVSPDRSGPCPVPPDLCPAALVITRRFHAWGPCLRSMGPLRAFLYQAFPTVWPLLAAPRRQPGTRPAPLLRHVLGAILARAWNFILSISVTRTNSYHLVLRLLRSRGVHGLGGMCSPPGLGAGPPRIPPVGARHPLHPWTPRPLPSGAVARS